MQTLLVGIFWKGALASLLFIFYLASLNELFLSAGRALLALLSAVKNRNLCNDNVRSDQMSEQKTQRLKKYIYMHI